MKIKRSIDFTDRNIIRLYNKALWKNKLYFYIKITFSEIEGYEGLVFSAFISKNNTFILNRHAEEEVVLNSSFFEREILYDNKKDVYIFKLKELGIRARGVILLLLSKVKAIGTL